MHAMDQPGTRMNIHGSDGGRSSAPLTSLLRRFMMPLGCDVARSVLPLRLGNLLRDALKEVLCFVFVTLVVCVCMVSATYTILIAPRASRSAGKLCPAWLQVFVGRL